MKSFLPLFAYFILCFLPFGVAAYLYFARADQEKQTNPCIKIEAHYLLLDSEPNPKSKTCYQCRDILVCN